MADRQSKRKSPPKVDEDAEPTGVKKVVQHPAVLLVLVVVIVVLAVLGILTISSWLSSGTWPWE